MSNDKTIYVKLTNACNLKCKHCYNAQFCDQASMSDEVLEQAAACISSFASKFKTDVQLHGGEPMLYGVSKISKFLGMLPPDVKTSMTTNLVYELDESKIELFKRMLPYDSTPFIMTSWDAGIRFTGSQEDLWKKNMLELHENGIVVQPIICVTTKLIEESPADVFDMLEELGVKNVNFERLTLTGNAADGKLKPTNRAIDDWLFSAYLEAKARGTAVPLFEGVESSMNGFLNGCRARMCMQNVLTINPDGSVAACPNAAKCWYAKLGPSGLIEAKPEAKQRLVDSERRREASCSVCKFYKQCNGDCCQLQHDETGCPGLKRIYEHLANRKTTT